MFWQTSTSCHFIYVDCVFSTVVFENCFQKNVFKPLIKIFKANLVHMPQGSVPESFVSPSCPKFHSHLKIKITQFDSATKSPKDYNFLNFQSLKFSKEQISELTAAPTDRANVPNISDIGTSPPYTKNKTQISLLNIIYTNT